MGAGKRNALLIAAAKTIVFVAVVFGTWACASGALRGPESAYAQSVGDGVYEIGVTAFQADKDKASMCDAAIVKPARLTVKGLEAKLRLTLQPVSMLGISGYLGCVSSFPGWSGTGLPDVKDGAAAKVVSTYDVVDDYNGANSSDSTVKGVKYPKVIELKWDLSASQCFVRVYVPVMNGLSAGSGWQFFRLSVDYDGMKPAGDAGDDPGEAGDTGDDSGNAGGGSSGGSDNPGDGSGGSGGDGGGEGGKPGGNGGGKPGATSGREKLDFKHLPDGSYTVGATMVKSDRKTPSMANAAIGGTVGLTVSRGAYRLEVALGKVAVGSQSSYLGSLRYFKTGYGKDANGAPTGKKAAARVVSYQVEGGVRVSDGYGADYPAKVSIPLIAEAKADGFVPLQVFVPVMEAIAAGTGTQEMYLKLDTRSVVKGGAGAQAGGGSAGGSAGPAATSGGASPSVISGSTLPTGASALGQGVQAAAAIQVDRGEGASVGDRGASVAAGDRQPPLKGALLPLGAASGAIVLVGAGLALYRCRGRIFGGAR